MHPTPPSADSPEYLRERMLERFRHARLDHPFGEALFAEALRRRLGRPREESR